MPPRTGSEPLDRPACRSPIIRVVGGCQSAVAVVRVEVRVAAAAVAVP